MSVLKKRLTATLLAVAGAMLLLASASDAATTFGSRLRDEPNQGSCPGGCTLAAFIQPIDPNGDPYSGGAPVDGVITKFRIRGQGVGGPQPVTFRLVRFVSIAAGGDSALATAVGTGPTTNVPPAPMTGDTPITEVGGRLPVTKGDHLAIDQTNVDALHESNSDKFTYQYAPPLVDGQGARDSSEVHNELLVQAVIEPDADHDGFGDETQDACPTQATTQGACDKAAPAVSGLKVGGGKVSYNLSEAATVAFKLEKAVKGRKVKGKCVRQTRRNRKRPRCTLFVTLNGNFPGPGAAGANQVTLPKVRGRKLGAGRYRLTMTVTDAAGNTASTTKSFTIKPKPKKKRHR
jgi:hypothetical protein